MENTVPNTVIIELATVERSDRAPSVPPDHSQPSELALDWPIGPLPRATAPQDRLIVAKAIAPGTSQKLLRNISTRKGAWTS